MSHVSLSKFAWTCLIIQIIFVILFILLVRYGESADAHHKENQYGTDHELKENVEKYPLVLDVNMMLIGGFGFLMCFLQRHGFNSLGMTLLVTVFCTEWSILLWGFFHLDSNFQIHVTMMVVLEAALTSAAVLITYGVVLGKINPFQILVLTLIESILCVSNMYLGYTVLVTYSINGINNVSVL